jgi:flavin-dependent dehydrogenase
LAGGWQVLEERLPEVALSLRAAGGLSWSPLDDMPATITDRAPRPGDEKFRTVTARRPVLEHAFATVAEKRVNVRRGVRVTGLLSDWPGQVGGVVLDHRTELRADLVIDASGRRSPLPDWLSDLGAAATAEESEASGFTYYSRFFRAPDGAEVPSFRGPRLTDFDCFSILVVKADARTWSLTVHTSSHDRPLKALHAESNWTRLIRACPQHEQLASGGEPITGVLPASGIVNRIRHFVIDGVPVATGVLAVGDSWACTNPAGGRGMTLSLMHAAITAETVGEYLKDPMALALAHHQETKERLLPWYRDAVRSDYVRGAQLSAVIAGRRWPEAPVAPYAALMRNFAIGVQRDADVLRAFLEIRQLLAPPHEVLARPGLIDRIKETAAGQRPVTPPGPSRPEVLALLS